MSQSYMVHASLGDPSRQAHQEILEEEHVRLDHAHDAFPRCHRNVEIAHTGIDRGIFLDGGPRCLYDGCTRGIDVSETTSEDGGREGRGARGTLVWDTW